MLGTLLIVSGPSGSGKTTLCRRAEKDGLTAYSISCTTRQPRPGEQDGVDYHFLTPEDFAAKVQAEMCFLNMPNVELVPQFEDVALSPKGMDKMELRPDGQLMDCYATILCERDSHKGIIIGRGGSMLKRIGSAAREDMEWLLGVRVNLQLWVKIKDDWRNRQSVLNELGYEG